MVSSLCIFRKDKNMIFNIYASSTPYSNLLKTIDQYPCLKDYRLEVKKSKPTIYHLNR